MHVRSARRNQPLIALLGAVALLLAACQPAGPSPTAAPAKPTEAPKPAAPAAATASPAAAPAASPPAAAPAAAAKPLAQPVKLTWGIPQTTPTNGLYAFYVARELGFWKEENLDVEIVQFGGSGATMQQLVAGKVDLATPSMPAVLNALGQGNQ